MDQVSDILSQAGTLLVPNSIADFLVYIVFFGCVLTLAFMPDGNGRAQNLMFGTMLCCVLDLLVAQQWLQTGGNSSNALFAFAVHVGIFVFPAITVGAIRAG
jgi:hypothetical protein